MLINKIHTRIGIKLIMSFNIIYAFGDLLFSVEKKVGKNSRQIKLVPQTVIWQASRHLGRILERDHTGNLSSLGGLKFLT